MEQQHWHALIFATRLMFVVFCSAYHCSEGKPRRFIRRWYGLDETLGGAFGLAMVWERGGREHRVSFCVMVHLFLTWPIQIPHFYVPFCPTYVNLPLLRWNSG